MKRLTYILIFTLSLFAGKVGGQCVIIRTITGPTPVCTGSTNNGYATESGMTGYVWIVSAGGTITTGAGTNSITVTWNAAGAQSISVNYIDTQSCTAKNPTVFNVTVNPLLPASVSVAASANPICAGTSVTFTATPTNGGTPTYQWKNGGISIPGETAATYTSTTLANGNVITVEMTSTATCKSGSPATSNTITMIVNPILAASVSIAAVPSGAICAGTSVTFTATPTNGGTPTYQWKKGGISIPGETAATYTSTTLANGNVITVEMTSTATCKSGSPATSNSITMIVNPILPASVNIAAVPSGAICAGAPVTFTATPTNGGTPTYQWKKGGISIQGATGATYTSTTLANGNVITVEMTSTATCKTGSPATSNAITMIVNPILPASVNIAAVPSGAICAGAPVTFTATSTNGGTPTYQWKKGGISIPGETAATFTSTTLANGNVITVEMTSTLTCKSGSPATSNSITMVVNPALTASISGGTSPICYNSSPGTFTANGGGGTGSYTYLWYKDLLSTGVKTRTYSPGNLTAISTFYCAITSGTCGTVNTSITTIIVNSNLTASISGGSSPICYNTSPGTFTANGGGGTGSYTYLWYKDLISTGITTQTYSPGNLTATSSFYCAITSGTCGTVSTSITTITVTSQPTAFISYTGSPWCRTEGVQNVTLVGTTGGSYSAPPGLTINVSSGIITPGTSTAGTYTVTYTIGASGGCGPTSAATSVIISPTPSAPGVGSITQTTCSVTTGSVVLIDLPSTGAWILTRSPGSVSTAGSGITTTISNLAPGSYTFTVTSSAGCVSPPSANVVINAQPASPASPVQSVNCSQGFDHAVVTVISPTGAGLEYSFDGGVYQSGLIFNSVNNGSHFLSVRNASGCTTTGTLFSVSCGCINPPTLTLSSSSGSTCGTTAMTVTGNSFGGTATSVTISSNGAGNVNPSSINTSPFVFTYTPDAADGGKIVIITVATNNPLGAPCAAAVAAYSLTVNALPAAPVVGTITNLTCTAATGSVILNGLPAIGTWTLIRNPGTIVTNGTGTSTTVTGLVASTYNFMVTSAEGCTSVVSSDVVITPQPSSPPAPVIGIITQPTCAISTGSVVLSGLPGTGTWLLTRNPGGVTISGSGTTAVSVLPAGTYTFTVTNTTGCISSPSGNVLVNTQPPIPAAPSIGAITPPTCTLSTGSVNLSGLPSSGTWTLIRYPGTVSTSGTGTNTTISGLASGSYNFTVTTAADGCLSVPSANVVIPVQPTTPSAPAVGTIIQPTFEVPTGSVVLSELPSTGSWVITILPGGVTTIGTGTSKTLTNLGGGVFTFKVTNSVGCTSTESIPVTISTPGVPVLIITDPSAVCSPTPVDITDSTITSGSTPGLIYTYWTDADATISYNTPTTSTAGTYYIKGTTVSGYFSIKPVIIMVDQLPISNAGIDQTLDYTFSTTLNAILINNETGIWSLVSGSGNFYDNTDPKTQVSGLSPGDNILLWTVKRGVCPVVFDTVNIFVQNMVIPTLMTPNMDGRNDYFVIRGLVNLGKTQLFVFDRRGAEVYKNMDYDNLWNGVDYNNNPLPDDTYFYVLKSTNGKPVNGYIVIRH